MTAQDNIVREARPNEYSMIGELMVNLYSQLDGFPSIKEQPDYYKMLANIGSLAKNPKTRLLITTSSKGIISGAVIYFGDMKYYGSGGIATKEKNAAGFRLLAVAHSNRGQGIGKLLTQACIQMAKKEHQS